MIDNKNENWTFSPVQLAGGQESQEEPRLMHGVTPLMTRTFKMHA